MKIMHIIWSLNLGGAESMLVDIINQQVKTEKVFLLIINSEIQCELIENIACEAEIITLNRIPGRRNIWHVLEANYHIYRISPDIIHCHGWDLMRIVSFNICKKVVTIHGVNNKFNRHLKRFHRIFAISNAVNDDISERGYEYKPVTVYNGIVFPRVKKRQDYSYDTFRIVQPSRLFHETKGQDILLRALKIVVYHYEIENIKVDFFGKGPSLRYLEELRKKLGLHEYCTFNGERSREFIYANLRKYNLLVQPSRYEGFGLTVVEAMAAKIPVLVSNIDGPMEIIRKGKYGYFFNTEEARDCANKIIKIMDDSKRQDFKNKMDINYRFAEKHFDIKQTAKNYIDEYKKILSEQEIKGSRSRKREDIRSI